MTLPNKEKINKPPKSKVIVMCGADEISFEISFAEMFDRLFLKPLEEEYKRKFGKKWVAKKSA